ncbi:hypothetical protein Q9L58_008698 [Maublancomyces gigas]|uniref:Uncharacterized protein n=1 Tax=Discina gigas TaxID=1032678 RepID=A0ABR3G9L9_9PEZI
MAGFLARHIAQYHVNNVGSPRSSVSSGSEIAGFDEYHDATESETESSEDGSEDKAGSSPDDEAGAPPDEPEPMVDVYTGSALTPGHVEDWNRHLDNLWNPWAPFHDAGECQLARWFIKSKTPQSGINQFFNLGLHSSPPGNRRFQSSLTLQERLEQMTGTPPVWIHGSERQRAWNSATVYAVLHEIHQHLISFETEAGGGLSTNCTDGHIRECWPILAAWLADHAEHFNLQNITNNACPKCEIEPDDLGTLIENPASKLRPQQDEYSIKLDNHERLQNLRQATPEARHLITEMEIEAGDLHKPDMLHVVYLGMMKHLMDWLTQFLTDWGRMPQFDAVWKEMPPYPAFVRPTKAYSEVSQRQGKEMHNFMHIVLPALASALHNPPPARCLPFQEAHRCVGALVRWALMADYPSHSEETLNYLKQYLRQFHYTKHVFRIYRAGKAADNSANVIRHSLKDEQATESQAVRNSNPFKRQRVYDVQKNEIRLAMADVLFELSHFNFPKMHLITHFSEHVWNYAIIPLYST